MASGSGPSPVAQFLAANRLSVYGGSLLAIILLRVADSGFVQSTFGRTITVSPLTSTVIVFGALLLMIITYLAERQVGFGEADEGRAPDYSIGTRALVGGAVVGIAFGVYLAFEGRLIVGLLFLFGALAFLQFAYRDTGGG